MVVPAERANFLMGKDLLSAKGINNMTLFDAHTRAQAGEQQSKHHDCINEALLQNQYSNAWQYCAWQAHVKQSMASSSIASGVKGFIVTSVV